ncbi:MAG: carbohydrate kinase family protein [Candidatus Woesearchaeota archaeon]
MKTRFVEKKEYDFITVGSATIDIFLTPDPEETEIIKISHKTQDFELIAYPLGSKILIEKIDYEIGGGGTNSAACLRKLNFSVGFFGCIGTDEYGEEILDYLKKENIDFIGKRSGKTGLSIILNSFTNERTVFTYKGANDLVDENLNFKCRALYCASLTKNAFKAQPEIFKKAKREGSVIFYNPSAYVAKMGLKELRNVLSYVDILIMNKEESQLLSGKTELSEIFRILNKIVKIVIITDGPNGIYFYDKRIYNVKAHKVKVLEPTGAGDAFASTFAGYLLKTNSILTSIKYGILNAESVIQKIGPKKGLLSEKELEKLMKNTKFEIVAID